MIDETVTRLRDRIRDVPTIDAAQKKDLLDLLGKLSDEVAELAKTQGEHAESIAGFTEVSTREAIRVERNPDLLELATEGLSRSVDGFEASHPRLVETVNGFCMMLSGIGI